MSENENKRPSRAVQVALSLAAAALIVFLVCAAVRDQFPLDRLPEEQREEQNETREEEAERHEERLEEEAERTEEKLEEEAENSENNSN